MSIDQASESRAKLPSIVAALFSNAVVDRDFAPYGLFLLRIAIGFDWIVHAFLKISRGRSSPMWPFQDGSIWASASRRAKSAPIAMAAFRKSLLWILI